MTSNNAYSSLCLFIIQDDILHVLLDMSGDTPSLPMAAADPEIDRDLAFTCRRISKELIGSFDYQLWPIHTYSGQSMPSVVKDPKSWPVLQSWAGIGRASELPDDVDQEGFIPYEKAAEIISPSEAGILHNARNTLRNLAGTSKLPAMFLAREFTLPEMRMAYEIVSEMPIVDAAFRRKVASQNIIREVGERRGLQTRPAKTYELVGARYDFERNLVFSDTKS